MHRSHLLFRISALLKGLHSLLEIIGGIFFLFISKDFVTQTILRITNEELIEDQRDRIANALQHFAMQYSLNTKLFIVFYLLSHGILKLGLVYGLLKQKIWVYPASVLVFTLFLLYQIYLYFLTPSSWLIILSAFDLFFIALVIREYSFLRKNRQH